MRLRPIIITAALLVHISRTSATLIAYEPFNYTVGMTLAGQGGGIGWNSNWITSPLNSTHSSIATSNLAVPRLAVAGNRLRTVNSGSDIVNWTNVVTRTTTNGAFQFDDTNAVLFPLRFYRALLP